MCLYLSTLWLTHEQSWIRVHVIRGSRKWGSQKPVREEQRVREMMEGSGVLPASDKFQEQTIQEAFPARSSRKNTRLSFQGFA